MLYVLTGTYGAELRYWLWYIIHVVATDRMRLSATQQEVNHSCVRARRTQAKASGVRNDYQEKENRKSTLVVLFSYLLVASGFLQNTLPHKPTNPILSSSSGGPYALSS